MKKMIVFNIIIFLLYLSLTNADDHCEINGILQCLDKCQHLVKCVAEHENNITTCDHKINFCNIISTQCENVIKRAAPGTCVIDKGDDIFTDDDIPCEYFINVPHPTDCTKYYKCEDGIREFRSCPARKAYDPVTRNCHLDLSAEVCTKGLTPECEESILAKSGPVDAYPRLYWFCTTYSVGKETYYKMRLHLCDDEDETFDANTNACVKGGGSGTTDSGTADVASSTPKPTTNSGEQTDCGGGGPPTCGNKPSKSPKDCNSYYVCDGVHPNPFTLSCPTGYTFNSEGECCSTKKWNDKEIDKKKDCLV